MRTKTITDNVFKLRHDFEFIDDKIKIYYGTGSVSNSLCVYLFDENKKSHHIYWSIDNDRCSQSFNKINNDKIVDFVNNVIKEKLKAQELEDRKREEDKLAKEQSEANTLSLLQDNF